MKKILCIIMLLFHITLLYACSANQTGHAIGEAAQSEDADKNIYKETKALLFGELGSLGTGYLAYSFSDGKDEDYRLYFFESENYEKSLEELDCNLEEADYVFPDVRENNAAIGDFSEIYFIEMIDIIGNGKSEILVIARYEKDDRKYFDTRVYEINAAGCSADFDLIQELNQKYSAVEDYPVGEVISLSHD